MQEATAYIEAESGSDRAVSWLAAMRVGIQKLETLPRAFPAVCLREGRPIHAKLVISHRVFYFVVDSLRVVYIIDVVHTARETKLAIYRDDDPPV